MKHVRQIMGMPVTLEVPSNAVSLQQVEPVFDYLTWVDETFSTYKETSEISRLNAGLLTPAEASPEMTYVLEQCEATKRQTEGYFDILRNGRLDPSGYVKGWAIQNAAGMLAEMGLADYYIEIAGDIQVAGHNAAGTPWTIGIRNPFNREEIVKRVSLSGKGIATSGTSVRGQHIYDPHNPAATFDIVSLTVIGEAIVDADRFATAAFAMGRRGIEFIARLDGFEGYLIAENGIATFTPGFSQYVLS